MATPLRVLLGREDISEFIDDGLTFSSIDQGGDEAANFTLPRRTKVRRGLPVVIQAGLETAWEGRVGEAGETFSPSPQTAVSCEGSGARLKDNEMAEIYFDQDLGHWQAASTQRRLNIIAAGASPSDASVTTDQGGDPSLAQEFDGAWAVGGLPISEGWYDAGDLARIGELDAVWQKASTVSSGADANWAWGLQLSTDDIATSVLTTGDLQAAGPGTASLTASDGLRQFAYAVFQYTAAGGSSNTKYGLYWTALVVKGTHGIPTVGTGAGGLYHDDIVRDVLSRVPGVTVGVLGDGSGLVVGQADYRVPVVHEQIVADMAKLSGWPWGTWAAPILGGQPRFDYAPYPASPTCEIPRRDCDAFDLTDRLSDLYDQVDVSWQDSAGAAHITRRTAVVPELLEADMSPRTLPIDMGQGAPADAEAFGDLVLALSARKARAAGSATIAVPVQGPGGPRPACLLRPGKDCVRVPDLPDRPWLDGHRYDFQISRIESTATREGVRTQLELGTGADLVEVLQARIALATDIATFGR